MCKRAAPMEIIVSVCNLLGFFIFNFILIYVIPHGTTEQFSREITFIESTETIIRSVHYNSYIQMQQFGNPSGVITALLGRA